MSEKTDTVNAEWPDASPIWDNPKDVEDSTPISAKENHNQLTVFINRDIYLLDQIEDNYDTLNSSISSVSSRVTVVEKTTNELTATVGDILNGGGGTGGGTGSIGSPLTDDEIDEIWANAK